MKLLSCSHLLTAGFVLSGAALAVNHNDECVDAAPITPGTPEPFATTLATPSVPDFTASCGAGGGSTSSQDIWFSFIATADYTARATTCGTANYDTKIEIYSGSCGALVSVGCNDDGPGCPGFTSQADFAAVSGTEYFVRIGGWGTTDAGGGAVLVTAPPAAVSNDECDTAAVITPETPTDFDTSLATPSTPDFTASCSAGGGSTSSNDVWFKFTAAADYTARATTCGTALYDTKIEIYDGSCGALVSVGCNDDFGGCSGFTSQVDFPATSGTEYFIRIGGYTEGDAGAGQILLTEPPSAGAPGDECDDAFPLAPATPTAFDTTVMTQSAPAWTCGVGGGPDIWFSYTTTGNDVVSVSTCGTAAYDTAIEIFSGDCANLSLLVCNDDGPGCPGFTSTAIAPLVPVGTDLFIRIGGWNGSTGTGTVELTLETVLENDDCGGAIALSPGNTGFDSRGATSSGVDMSCVFNGELGDVWYSYTAIGDCPVTVDLTGTFYDTGMSVYSGDCAALTEVGCDDDGGGGLTSKVTFAATAGTTYYIQIGGFNGATGAGIIRLTEGVGSVVCLGNANSTGAGALLRACGSDLVADNALTLEVTDLPANQNVLFVNSQETILVANPGGSQGDLCIGSLALGRHLGAITNSGASGTASLGLNLANIPTNAGFVAILAGETWYWQAWYRDVDGGGAATSNLSSAVGVTFN
ncbi:MAG: hypothetical protein VX015_08645 [Planctomycetota bacterium]|nr:hypothetical protein [Planctomycetota bacterium]